MTVVLDVLRWIGILMLVVLLFNLVIVVHEVGHFLAARWRGLKIDKFQIWFGKPIWKKTVNGVQYGLGTIPFGGFVALPQMAPMEAIEGKSDDGTGEPLKPISPLDKIIVAFAGPLFSFLLAFAFSVVVWAVGKPIGATEIEAVVGYADPELPAGQPGGLQPGDKILAVDGKPVKRFAGQIDSVTWGIVSAEKDDIEFSILRDGKPQTVMIHAPTSANKEFKAWAEASWMKKIFDRPPFRKVGIAPGTANIAVAEILKNSPAEQAGFKKGDILRSLNGAKLYSDIPIGAAIRANPEAPLKITVERDGQPVELTVLARKPDEPKDYDGKGILGMAYEDKDEMDRKANHTDIDHPTPYAQISDSLRTTFATLGALVSKDSSVQPAHMSSAIGIISIYHQLFGIENGWMLILWFTVVLNVNLAILNMLPLPVLDGGHITMALIEAVRGKPLGGKILEYVQASFAVLLLSFMFWVMLKDIGGFFGGDKARGGEVKFYPPNSAEAKPATN